MKTLSVRQPWAELIIQGRKTLELRTWTVKYRGPLAIHASHTVEREACLAHGLDPDQVTTGAVIGVVDLVEIIELDAASYAARRAEHLAGRPFPVAVGAGLAPAQEQPPGPATTLYGWRLANPRPLAEPAPMRGRMGVFEAPLALGFQSQGETESPLQADSSRGAGGLSHGATWARNREQTARTFDLRVLPISTAPGPGEPAYRLTLCQRSVEPPPNQRGLYEPGPPLTHKIAELGGSTLRAVADHVMEALRANGYKPTELGAGRREPFSLAEENGVRLGLLFLAVRPISKVERVELIAQGIRAMTSEEAYYWYSKCTGGPAAERAQRAMRVLLSDD